MKVRAPLVMVAFAAAARALSKPHVLLVVADDYGYNDIGYHQNHVTPANPSGKHTTNGKDLLLTPFLDQLAASGTKLESYYVQPLCSPTRGTLMSGRYPSHTGVGPSVIRPSRPYALPKAEVTIAEKFKEAGYATHAVGKWHMGYCDQRYSPTFRGFDSFMGYLNGAEDYFQHTRSWDKYSGLDFRNSSSMQAPSVLPPALRTLNGTYSTFAFSAQVAKIVAAHARAHDKHAPESDGEEAPLFVYLPFQAVHGPLQAPQKYVDMYAHIKDEQRRMYAAMVTAMDDAVKEVVEAFQANGLWTNTIMVFTTDNGGPVASANNYPLRGGKSTTWEGGIRGNAFVRGPNVPANRSIYGQLMHSTDWLPTLSQPAGYGLNGTQALDGHDQWPVLTGQANNSSRDRVIINCPAAGQPLGGGVIMSVPSMGNYKLLVENEEMQTKANITQKPPPALEDLSQICAPPKAEQGMWLFALDSDPHECENLFASQPATAQLLLQALQQHQLAAVPDLALL